MRKIILAAAAFATVGAFSFTAEAMPVGSSAVAPAQAGFIQKTAVVVIKKRPMRRVCRTVVTRGRRVTTCR